MKKPYFCEIGFHDCGSVGKETPFSLKHSRPARNVHARARATWEKRKSFQRVGSGLSLRATTVAVFPTRPLARRFGNLGP